MTLKFRNLFVVAVGLMALTIAAYADDRIVAVVNDQVITQSQLDARTTLNMRQLGLISPKDAQRAAVQKRTLSALIDEELQRQYAATVKLKVTDKDIAASKEEAIKAVGGEANWANLTKGLDGATKEKLAAETLWKRIIARDIQPRVQVSTVEADRLISELAKSRHVLDREISIIQLNVTDEASSEKAQLNRINDLKKKVSEGETFADLARANSDDKSAASGGNLGWFSSGELNPQLEGALDKMQPGQVSEPIRTPLGWYLVKLENVRTTKPVETGPETQVDIFLLATKTPDDEAAAKELNKSLDTQADSLKDTAAVRDYFAGGSYVDSFPNSAALGWVSESDLDPTLLEVVKKVNTGRWSKLTTIKDTTMRVFVADRKQAIPAQLQAYRERVMNNMYGTRIELESRRFMQTLRQRAFLDVRM